MRFSIWLNLALEMVYENSLIPQTFEADHVCDSVQT